MWELSFVKKVIISVQSLKKKHIQKYRPEGMWSLEIFLLYVKNPYSCKCIPAGTKFIHSCDVTLNINMQSSSARVNWPYTALHMQARLLQNNLKHWNMKHFYAMEYNFTVFLSLSLKCLIGLNDANHISI